MAKSQTIELKQIEVKNAQVFIVGDSDLILNKVNARYERSEYVGRHYYCREVEHSVSG